MTAPSAEHRQIQQGRLASVQTYARMAGLLLLISLVAGGLGESYIPSKIISSADAAATARNIVAYPLLFRLGFAAYLVEALCDTGLTMLFFVLLRPVGKNLALLAVFFRILATALFAVAEVFYFAPSRILGGADYLKSFSQEQLQSLALLSFHLYGALAGVFMVFYGVASILLGFLMFRSGYLPKFLGVLWMLGGVGFVASSFALVLAPAYASFLLLVPTIFAGLSLTLWLLIKGIDVPRWE